MTSNQSDQHVQVPGRWTHRLAWVLVCATFPLIWMGGLVTTYGAGMAVPDWPTTYGHWFYPLQRWLWTWGDLLLEHGHRTLAQLVGLITITLAVALWRLDRRKWMRYLAAAAVVGVCFQGVLGGLRVLGDSLLLAKIHGCTAPLFFALCAALVTLTSRPWQQHATAKDHPAARRLHRLTLAATLAIYLQIVLGAQLRHLAPDGGTGWFELWVWLKLITAGVIAIGLVWLLIHVLRRVGRRSHVEVHVVPAERMIVRRTKLLVVLFAVQLVLGAGTWVTNYGWPRWFTDYIWALRYTVVAEGRLQVITTTAHAAVGSLTLVAGLSLTLWSLRLLRAGGVRS